jgi:hypothetical protein
VKRALPEVMERLVAVARVKKCPLPKQESIAKAMAAYPDRDFVAVADELAFWAEHGNGSRRKVKVLAGLYRNFLKRSDPKQEDALSAARELDELEGRGSINGTAVEL